MTKSKKSVKGKKKQNHKKAVRKSSKHVRTEVKKVHGKGSYFGDLGASLGGTAGGIVDGVVSVAKVLGFGDYKVKKNTLSENGGPPEVVNSKHSNIIRHREYLGDITGHDAFTVQNFSINPGQSSTFPWLAPIAAAYEQYEVRGMLFEFLSTASNAVATTDLAQGTVIMATEYNSNLPVFSNKSQMENHEYCSTTKPAVSCIHPIECAKQLTPQTILYVRTGTTTVTGGGTPANGTYNPLAYDLGQFQIATQGLPSSCVIGELWVTYEIQFLKPRILSATTSNVMSHYYWDDDLGSQPSVISPFQNLRNKNSGITTSSGAGSILNIPAGKWLVIQLMNTHTSGDVTWPTFEGVQNGLTVTKEDFFFTSVNGDGTQNSVAIPINATSSIGPNVLMECYNSPSVWYLTSNSTGTYQANMLSYDLYLVPFGSALTLESRRAIDWDPMTILNRRIDELMSKMGRDAYARAGRLRNHADILSGSDSDNWEEEKHSSSAPHALSSSTLDLAKAIRGLVKQ